MKINDTTLASLGLQFDSRGHFPPFISGLLEAGFRISSLPVGEKIKRNGQIALLEIAGTSSRFRVFIYKVTVSSRGKSYERRIEPTNTYPKGNLRRMRSAQDVVLGWDYVNEVFVGLDPRHLKYGGKKGNASKFFDGEGLTLARPNSILVRPHRSSIFPEGYEFQAFFERSSVADYLSNIESIHAGQYRGETFLGRKVPPIQTGSAIPSSGTDLILTTARSLSLKKVSKKLIETVEKGKLPRSKKTRVSAKTFAEIKRTCEENGRLGEEFVFDFERSTLTRRGHPDLASKVQWVSETSVFEGYDILSFWPDGRKKYIEVKSTSGEGNVFDISANEWNVGLKFKDDYFVYRVTQVTSKKPRLKTYRNLADLEAAGLLKKSVTGWKITLL